MAIKYSGVHFYKVNDEMLNERLKAAIAFSGFKGRALKGVTNMGFVPAFGLGRDELTYQIPTTKSYLFKLQLSSPVVSSSVVTQFVEEANKKHLIEYGFNLSRPDRAKLKRDKQAEMEVNAPIKQEFVDCYFDVESKLLAVATTKESLADSVVALVRKALGSLAAIPCEFETDIEKAISSDDFSEVNDVVMIGDHAEKVTFKDLCFHDLKDQVKEALSAGYSVQSASFEIAGDMLVTVNLDTRKKSMLKIKSAGSARKGEDYEGSGLERAKQELDADLILVNDIFTQLAKRFF